MVEDTISGQCHPFGMVHGYHCVIPIFMWCAKKYPQKAHQSSMDTAWVATQCNDDYQAYTSLENKMIFIYFVPGLVFVKIVTFYLSIYQSANITS